MEGIVEAATDVSVSAFAGAPDSAEARARAGVVAWVDGGLEISRDELIDICVGMLLAAASAAPGIADQVGRD